MKIDLHCHSNLSDGSLTPWELAARATARGVEILSITDHDTVAAYAMLHEREQLPLKLIPGVEFSTTWRGMGVHIVGLNVALESQSMLEATAFQANARRLRARTIADRLVKLGAPKTIIQLAVEPANNQSIGRPHFARHLVASGLVRDLKSAYKKYLGAGKPGDVNTHWAPPEQIISWIHESSGMTVLAHPSKYKLTHTKLDRLISDFEAMGGDAMEVISGNQSQHTIDAMAGCCIEHNLLASVGSDFHEPGQAWNELGNFPALPQICSPVWEAIQT